MRTKFFLWVSLFFCFSIAAQAQLGLLVVGADMIKGKKERKKQKEKAGKAFADYPDGGMPEAQYNEICLPAAEMKDKTMEANIVKAFMQLVKRDGSKENPKLVRIISPNWQILRNDLTGAITGRGVVAVIGSDVGDKCISQGFFFYQDYDGTGYQENFHCSGPADPSQKDINCSCLEEKYFKVAETKTEENKPAAATAPGGAPLLDLSSIGINATMKVPAGVRIVEGSYGNYIKDNEIFQVSVEETSMTLDQMKAKVQADKMNEFQKFVTTDAKGFIYIAKVMSSTPAHFEYIITISGKTYRLYDKRVTPLTPEQVQPMFDAVKTITAK